jgi:hypothetical protein
MACGQVARLQSQMTREAEAAAVAAAEKQREMALQTVVAVRDAGGREAALLVEHCESLGRRLVEMEARMATRLMLRRKRSQLEMSTHGLCFVTDVIALQGRGAKAVGGDGS